MKLVKQALLLAFKTAMVLLIVLLIACGGMLLRLRQGPINLDWMLEYVQLRNLGVISEIKGTGLTLSWMNLHTLPEIYLENAELIEQSDCFNVQVQHIQVRFNWWSLLSLSPSVETIVLKNPKIQLMPGCGAQEKKMTLQELSDLLKNFPRNFSNLNSLEVINATIEVSSLETPLLIHVPRCYAQWHRQQLTLQGTASFSHPQQPYDVDIKGQWSGEETVDLTVAFKNVNLDQIQRQWGLSLLSDEWALARLPVDGQISFTADLKEGLHGVFKSYFNFKDGAEIVALMANGSITLQGEDITVPLQLRLGTINLPKLYPLWPQSLGTSTRTWMVRNMPVGRIDQATFAGTFTRIADKETFSHIHGDLDLSQSHVIPLQGLAPVQKVNAHATYTDKDFSIDVLSGNIGGIQLESSKIVFTGLDAPISQAMMDFKLKGGLREVLSYVERPPLALLEGMALSPRSFSGQAAIDMRLAFPLRETVTTKDVKVNLKGALTQVSYTKAMKQKPALHFKNGQYTLVVTEKDLKLQGRTQLNGAEATVSWTETFDKSAAQRQQYTVKGHWPFDVVRAFIPDKKMVTGAGTVGVDFAYTEGKGKDLLRLALDFTQAQVILSFLGEIKRIKEKGSATFTAEFFPKTWHILEASVDTPKLKVAGKGQSKGNGHFVFSVPQFTFDKMSGRLTFETQKGRADRLTMHLPYLDLRPFLEDNDEEEAESEVAHPLSAQITVDRALGYEDIILNQLDVQAQKLGQEMISYKIHGAFSPKEEVTVSFSGSGEKTFHAETKSVSKLLRFLDMTGRIDGGEGHIDLTGVWQKGHKQLKGHVKAKNLLVKDAPLMAHLFSLASVSGMLHTLKGDGLLLEKVEAQVIHTPKSLEIISGLAQGSGIGLTLDGTYVRQKKTMDFNGTLIPAYTLNKILAGIPLLGTLLSGGDKNGIFAFTFVLTGHLTDPQLSSNPLSGFTPGIFRKMFEDKKEHSV